MVLDLWLATEWSSEVTMDLLRCIYDPVPKFWQMQKKVLQSSWSCRWSVLQPIRLTNMMGSYLLYRAAAYRMTKTLVEQMLMVWELKLQACHCYYSLQDFFYLHSFYTDLQFMQSHWACLFIHIYQLLHVEINTYMVQTKLKQ